MELHERIKAALPNCIFRPPATERDVLRIERELGVALPEDLRQLYVHFDGLYSGKEARLDLLPLIGKEPRKAGELSVLHWNRFRKGPGWEKGYEPPKDVLELGFLNDDYYVGIRFRSDEIVVVLRCGNQVIPAERDLCQLLLDAYDEERKLRESPL